MEAETPEAGEPPLADICGVQFGLMTTSVMLKLSVFDPSRSLTKPKEVMSARLGLPTASGQCTTCTASTIDQCQGHFGHILLPTPIFHSHHVGRLIKLLRKICLNCGKPKKKSRGRTRLHNNENQEKKDEASEKSYKRNFSAFLDEDAEASEVIVLSSDEEKQQQPTSIEVIAEGDILGGKASTSSARKSRKGKRKHHSDSSATDSIVTPTVVDLTDVLVCVRKPKKSKGVKSRSGVEVVDTFCPSSRTDDFSSAQICFYCTASSQSDRYPEVQLTVDVKEGSRTDTVNLAKSILMEIKNKDYKNVAPDYWSFVGGNSTSSNQRVPKTRHLLPSEALKIIRKIPPNSLLGLGLQPDVAPPEALIVECLPVPPNCTRLQEDAIGAGGTNIGFKIGCDRATQAFTKLVNKINSIKASRYGRPTFHAAGLEANSLQALFGQYLREKGAPKAAPGKEKKKTDHVGRVQKRDSRWSLEWLKRNVLGKRSGFCARNVVTGDPFLTVEEIGVPLEVAKYLTYPVRVTKLNQGKLQVCVEIGQELGMTRACGAVRIVKNGQKLEVTPKSAHQLEIGDVVHRHLSDGDLVYVNRPPSLHKHSLIALKTHLQDSATFTINPAVCAPLHADFDGDCLHVFVPQSEESKAELHQLLAIPEQILPSVEGKTIIGLSQDNILATHLATSSPLFVDKELMHQLAMSSSWKLPVPTILKSPKGGPLWTGKQVIDLTIPDGFSYRNDEGTIIIQDGELMSYGAEANWLGSTSGLVSTLARHDPKIAVKHLDCSQAVLREWLLSRGFSVSLKDFYAAPDRDVRSIMKAQILNGLEQAQYMAIEKQRIFDRKRQKLESEEGRASNSPTTISKDQADGALEDVAVTDFLENFNRIGDQIGEAVGSENSLLAMVRSGSKGSMGKAFQQIGCLGLQLYKGEHLLALQDNNKLCAVAEATGNVDKWEARGLVRNSLLDGLEPMEFFLHAIAVRAGLLRQSLEVTDPGELFKRLMLFLRDVHVSYDGTIRNKCGLEIIQFCDEGLREPHNISGVSMDGNELRLPGEAVGILAATAIAQPAYQVMLEASHNVGSKKIRPLELLQETIFPRSTSSLKLSDRRSVLRLTDCDCGKLYCDERRILQVQSELQPRTLQSLAISTAIEYIPDASEEWDAFIVNGERQKLLMPWVGHILLDQTAMIEIGLNKEKLLDVLKKTFESHGKTLLKFQLGRPLFCFRDECSCMGVFSGEGPCLHFSPRPKSNVKRRKAKVLKDATVEILDILQIFVIPLVMNTTVKGDDRIESTRIVWEDAAWSPRHSIRSNAFSDVSSSGELTLEVTVKEKFSSGRGVPWMITKEACLPVEEAIDWRRSSPYSVQEMKHAFGVEAARDCILQRFNLTTQASGSLIGTQHLKLVADLMVHAGEVHGLTSHGFRDFMRSLKTTAPFTAGAFRAPIKNFMEAGERGDEEVLSGVLASSVFGKRVPLGTGADFSLKVKCSGSSCVSEGVDVHQCLIDLIAKIGVEKPETPPHSEVEFGDVANDSWIQSSAFETGVEDAGGWGTGAGGWGSPDKNAPTKSANAGGWASPAKSPSTRGVNLGGWEQDAGGWGTGAGGWGSPDKNAPTKGANSGGWASPAKSPSTRGVNSGAWEQDVGGWSSPEKDPPTSSGGWGSLDKSAATERLNSGGWGDEDGARGSVNNTAPTQESNSNGWKNSVNTIGSKSSVRDLESTPDTENGARGLSDQTRSTPAEGFESALGDIDAAPPTALESGGCPYVGSDGASAWVVDQNTECSNADGSGWDSSKVPASNWTDDSDVEATYTSWDNLPCVQTNGCREKLTEDNRNRSLPTEQRSPKRISRHGSWDRQENTDAASTQLNSEGKSERGRNNTGPAARPGVWPVHQVECRSQTAVHSSWTCNENTVCRTTESNAREGRSDFRPTGANITPLGKVRVFQHPIYPEDDGNRDPTVTGLKEDHHSYLEVRGISGLLSHPRSTFASESVEKRLHDVESELAGNSRQGVEGAALWMNTEDGNSTKDGDSGWSSLTVHSQTIAADLSERRVATSGDKIDGKVVWPPDRRGKDGANPCSQLHGNELQSSGGWGPKRDLNWKRTETKREVDSRRESEEWKELETLVWSVRNILKKYELEDRLSEEDHNFLLRQVLPYHPSSAAKVGCGIDYVKVANHMDTRCFFLVRKDGTAEDFSYHKCLLTLASRKNPYLADLYKSQYMSRRKIEGRAQVDAVAYADMSALTVQTPVGTDVRDVRPEISGNESGVEVQAGILRRAEAE